MPLIRTISSTDPTHLTIIARGKAAKEAHRQDLDLVRLLAHVNLLDRLEHTTAKTYVAKNPPKPAQVQRTNASEPQQQSRRRSSSSSSSSSESSDDDLDGLFDFDWDSSAVCNNASMIQVEEVEIEDWDA